MTAYVLALGLMYAVSKLGCFFAGCCAGMRYQGPGSIRYLDNGAAGEYLFPVQLAETILFLLAFLLLHRMAERKRNGIIPKSLLLYAILKFVLDYLRYYEDRKIFSANQWGCLLVAVSVLLYEAVRQIKQRANNKVINGYEKRVLWVLCRQNSFALLCIQRSCRTGYGGYQALYLL